MQSQQPLILIKNQGFFPANVSYTNGLGDLHHLLARYKVDYELLASLLSRRKTSSINTIGNIYIVIIVKFEASQLRRCPGPSFLIENTNEES